MQHKTYQSIVPIHRIIGNQGKVTTLTITGILYESGHNFIGNAVNTSHYKTNTGLEAVYSKKHGLLLHLEEHKQMSNGCYFHRQSILHHFDEIQRAVKYIVKNKVFDRQEYSASPIRRTQTVFRLLLHGNQHLIENLPCRIAGSFIRITEPWCPGGLQNLWWCI